MVGAPAPVVFHAFILLDFLRTQVSAWASCIIAGNPPGDQFEGLIWGLHGLAMTTRCGGLGAYAHMCDHLCIRLGSAGDSRQVSGETLALLRVWLASSYRYLREPANPSAVADLVVGFVALPWEKSLFNSAQQTTLFHALLLPA